jgi:hypothetical protein
MQTYWLHARATAFSYDGPSETPSVQWRDVFLLYRFLKVRFVAVTVGRIHGGTK